MNGIEQIVKDIGKANAEITECLRVICALRENNGFEARITIVGHVFEVHKFMEVAELSEYLVEKASTYLRVKADEVTKLMKDLQFELQNSHPVKKWEAPLPEEKYLRNEFLNQLDEDKEG